MIRARKGQPHPAAVAARYVGGELVWSARCLRCPDAFTTELPGDLGKRAAQDAADAHRAQTGAWLITTLD